MNRQDQQLAVGIIVGASQGGLPAIVGLTRSRKPEVQTLAKKVLNYMESPSVTLPEAIDTLINSMKN